MEPVTAQRSGDRWAYLGQITSILSTGVINLVALSLGVHSFAAYAIATARPLLISGLFDSALNLQISRQGVHKPRIVLGMKALVAAPASIISVLLLLLGGGSEEETLSIVLLGIAVVFGQVLFSGAEASLIGTGRIRQASIVKLGVTAGLCFGALASRVDGRVETLLASMAMVYLIGTAATFKVSRLGEVHAESESPSSALAMAFSGFTTFGVVAFPVQLVSNGLVVVAALALDDVAIASVKVTALVAILGFALIPLPLPYMVASARLDSPGATSNEPRVLTALSLRLALASSLGAVCLPPIAAVLPVQLGGPEAFVLAPPLILGMTMTTALFANAAARRPSSRMWLLVGLLFVLPPIAALLSRRLDLFMLSAALTFTIVSFLAPWHDEGNGMAVRLGYWVVVWLAVLVGILLPIAVWIFLVIAALVGGWSLKKYMEATVSTT